MMKIIMVLVGLGYLVMVGIRYLRILSDGGNAQAARQTNEAQREKRYLKILDLQGKVTVEQIKKSYRKRIAEYHPDKVQNMAPEIRKLAERRTTELTEAYAYLKEKHQIS